MRVLLFLVLFPILIFGQSSFDDAKQLYANKDYKKAAEVLEPFVAKNPKHLEAVELYGDANAQQSKWDTAITHYKFLISEGPENANYHYKYGGALGMKALSISKIRALGIIGEVKAAFLKAAELDPTHIDTRWALVELYMQLPGIIGGSKSKSLKYAQELETLSTVDGYLAKGYIYEYDNEPELAETYYKLAISVGGSVTCYDKLITLYEKEGRPQEAISVMEAAHIKHQRNALHYQIGKVCAEYNVQLEKGAYCLQVYLKQYSVQDGVPKAWAYYRLAQIYKHQKDKSKALKYINKAISELPDSAVFTSEKQEINNL
ncbi:MAG: tetratricopeptide repeat protein [Bizionia paragorgiae]|uniref:tetratricopeptide repeat protein n=1 Tax=Bizionia paragorgiae TaxID=283786 RepID=UPI003C677EB7